eukprot:8235374-Alexandrium_andersonii.AAC.1
MPRRAVAQETARSCRKLQETAGNCRKLQEVAGGCRKMLEAARNCRKPGQPQKTKGELARRKKLPSAMGPA